MRSSKKQKAERLQRSKRMMSAGVLVGFLLLLVGTGLMLDRYLDNPRNLPIHSIDIRGKFLHLDRANLQKVLASAISGGFFSADIQQIRKAALDLPWVEEASITRIWPDKLLIQVSEKRPLARWGDKKLLSEQGAVFAPLKPLAKPPELQLYGKPEHAREILAFYQRAEKLMTADALYIQRAGKDARGEWSIELKDGLQLVLGSEKPERRLMRFLRVYPVIKREQMQPQRIDLRYEQGFAVSWKQIIQDSRSDV